MKTGERIANRDARLYVQNHKPFKGSNLCAYLLRRNGRNVYVVYSYGYWPLFAYDEATCVWYENLDYASPTTSKHRTQTHPFRSTIACDVDTIHAAIEQGAIAITLRGEKK